MTSHGGLATYYPIKSIDGQTIVLRGDERQTFRYSLTSDTVYCQGSEKQHDWTYLKKAGKKTITIMTNGDADNKALIVWDRPPSISTSHGAVVFALPQLCK